MITNFPPASHLRSPAPSPSVSLAAECKNPYDYLDPPCKHNASLFTDLSPHPANCAHCVASDQGSNATACPVGWHGIDCSACAARESCPDKRLPDGTTLRAKGCTSACLVPTPEVGRCLASRPHPRLNPYPFTPDLRHFHGTTKCYFYVQVATHGQSGSCAVTPHLV